MLSVYQASLGGLEASMQNKRAMLPNAGSMLWSMPPMGRGNRRAPVSSNVSQQCTEVMHANTAVDEQT
jgi:hypothetical protein